MRLITRRMTQRLRHRLAVLSLAILVSLLARAAAGQNPRELRPQGYVSDFARVISLDTRAALESICQELDRKAQAQIAIVTVRSLARESIEQYAADLATRLKIGPDQTDRAVLILVVPRQRRYWVQVGNGLRPLLPESLLSDFGREAVPQLQIGNYSGAVLLLTQQIAAVIAKNRGVTLDSLSQTGQAPFGTEIPPPPLTPRNVAVPLLSILVLLFFPLLGLLLRMRAGRRYGRGHGVVWASAPWFLGGGFGGGGGSWGGGGFGGCGGFGAFGGPFGAGVGGNW